MVPGNLPSQLEILSTGQNYYETPNRLQMAEHGLPCWLMSRLLAATLFAMRHSFRNTSGHSSFDAAKLL